MNWTFETHRSQWVAVFLLFVAFSRNAQAAGELEGQIRGRVVEAATDVPIPGATVTANAPNLGYPRTTTSDEDGAFLLPNLPVGTYTVTIDYAGAKPISRAVVVQPGVTSPLNIRWSVELTEVETTTVIEERPVTNPDSTQTGAVVSVELQRHTPGSHANYFDLVQQVAGVRRGTQAANYEPFVNGARAQDTRFYVDGLEVTDLVTRFSNQQVPIEGLDSLQVITGGFDAEYNAFGGVINAVTREGSDEWHGRVSTYLRNSRLYLQEAVGNGLEDTQPFNNLPIQRSWTTYDSANLAGPLIKHRLWISGTFSYQGTNIPRFPSASLGLPPPTETHSRYFGLLKVTGAPSPQHRLSLSLIADPLSQENIANKNLLNLYQAHNDEGGYNGVFSWSFFPNPAMEFHLDAGVRTWHRNSGPSAYFGKLDYSFCERFSPRNCQYDKEAPSHHNQADDTYWYNPAGPIPQSNNAQGSDYKNDKRYSFQLDPKLTVHGQWFGEHTAKIGAQLKFLRRTLSQHTPGFYNYEDNNPQAGNAGVLEDGLCDFDNPDPQKVKTAGCFQRTRNEDRNITERGFEASLFLQDSWKIRRWFTVTPGIRIDKWRATANDGKVFNSPAGVGPGIGLVVDITRDQKTIFSTHYGRRNLLSKFDSLSNYDSRVQNISRRDTWDNVNKAWVLGPPSGGIGGSILETGVTNEHQDEFTSSIRREVLRNTSLEVEHIFRTRTMAVQTLETNQVWDPTGFRVVDYRDGINHQIMREANYRNWENYNGFTASLQSRATQNVYFLASYTLSWLWGASPSATPTQTRFREGFLDRDYRHRLTAAGSYTFNIGLIFGVKLEHTSGSAVTKRFYPWDRSNFSDTGPYRSPQGTDPGSCSGNNPGTTPQLGNFNTLTFACGNNVNLISELRTPPRTIVDVQIEYDFYQLIHQRIALSLEIFNLFNEKVLDPPYPLQINRDDRVTGDFGFGTKSDGLQTRIGARWDF